MDLCREPNAMNAETIFVRIDLTLSHQDRWLKSSMWLLEEILKMCLKLDSKKFSRNS